MFPLHRLDGESLLEKFCSPYVEKGARVSLSLHV